MLIGVEVQAAHFMTVDKPAPVVLFEYVKSLVSATRPDVGRMETVSRAEMP